MDLICVMCGQEPKAGEYYIKLEKWFKSDGGSRQIKEPVMICSSHLPEDINQAFSAGGYKYRERLARDD